MTFVTIKQLTFRYARRQPPVIDEFSCTLQKGEVVGILGASGSGKSSLLRLIAGLELPEKGTIMIDGTTMVNDGMYVDVENRGVGMVFQDYALFPHLNAAENIAFGLHKLKRAARKERVQEMLELVQLSDYAKRYPHELSGGQQQRIALARALAPKPSILLMDEPFSSLDANLKSSLRNEIRHILKKAGITSLLVSHDAADIEAICDRSIRIEKELAGATA